MNKTMKLNKLSASILAAMMASPAAVAHAASSVEVEMNGQYVVNFEQAVRLRDVLQQANQVLDFPDTYWPEARLGLVEDAEFDEFKASVLERLAQREDDVAAQTLAQLQGMNFISQPFQHIDLAKARQDIRYNPLLQPGRYTLTLPPRPNTIHVYGAVNDPQHLAFQPGTPLSAYVRKLQRESILLSDANRDSAYLVRNGEVIPFGWAMYNGEGIEALPGDIIYIGYKPSLNARILPLDTPAVSAARSLDEDIARLLGNMAALPSGETTALNVTTPSSRHWSRYERTVSRNNYGGAGLMQTPSARMMEVGSVGLSYSDMDEYRRYSVSLQVLSWIEATAFYVRIPNRLYSDVPSFSGDNIYTDKGFDVKARLWEESYWLPEVSVGLRDFAGTGLFDGEYVVANKQFGAFDFSLGVGFGRLGTRDSISNPLCEVSSRFCDRPSGFTRGGGQFEYDQWFRGPAALFGGVQWQSPWEPLTVKIEYDGNNFSEDEAGVDIEPATPWNFGVNYRPYSWLDLQASYERGNTFMFNVTLQTNFNHLGQHRVEPKRVQPRPTPEVQHVDDVDWRQLHTELYNGFTMGVSKVTGDDERVRLYMSPYRYRNPEERYDRAARILADNLPESVKEYEFVQYHFDSPMVSTTVDADEFKARVWFEDIAQAPDDTSDLFTRRLPEPATRASDDDVLYDPDWSRHYSGFGIKPFFNQDFGSPESFHIYQLGLKPFARYWFGNNFEVFGELGINIANNYDRFNFLEDRRGGLPPVRTDARSYVQNDVWLDRLQATYYNKISNNVYGMVYGGYLERMFSGVGAEVLWRPVDSNWAIGADINRVRQRDFGGWGGLQDYTATTGFVSLYYQMPWLEDTMVRFDVGQFLAEDRGVNVAFQKRFDSGVMVGAYAAFTNVSQEDYGEGSFTKGFFMSIPFDLIGVRPTRQRVGMHWIPLARNGGRQLIRRTELWGVTDDVSPYYHR
ncbi:MAG: YjbH domain-containing protein [Firmicutes bacterium]|nr:YjbH domain-containing protein [Bacillota bacterium]